MGGGSVTGWLAALRQGDAAAAQHLWERYYSCLVRLAREHLRGLPRRAADEEDVALSAFAAFCAGLTAGRFPNLHDRVSLWGLLLTLTERRAIDLARHERAERRGGGMQAEDVDVGSLVDDEPTPAFAAEVADEAERLLKKLDGDVSGKLRQVAILKMEGFSNEEIAGRLGCAARTVQRKIDSIREIWSEEVPS
jgi:RNA polymerase sigma factor (sigma-70 family)